MSSVEDIGQILDGCPQMCMIVEFSCPLDINTIKKVSEKIEVYTPLVRNYKLCILVINLKLHL